MAVLPFVKKILMRQTLAERARSTELEQLLYLLKLLWVYYSYIERYSELLCESGVLYVSLVWSAYTLLLFNLRLSNVQVTIFDLNREGTRCVPPIKEEKIRQKKFFFKYFIKTTGGQIAEIKCLEIEKHLITSITSAAGKYFVIKNKSNHLTN